ncbi:hypothetical protein J4E86_000287 [Alternaria arbusti]|uniref:uncharacterized protein n=1 Tax=Alternaria arbusti TaxID=232088 RepID=UPI00221FE042|nr:uncharacterized protein J4E86_000287 [Alternaria arbusti]KAI4961260.1 hypothetical protein J4E86_000287 [Alternaria arbusti]
MAFLFFLAVFTLLGWLACEHDDFWASPPSSSSSSVPAAGPHTAPSSPSSSLPRRERRALARARSRSPPPVPEWARPGSLLSPPRQQQQQQQQQQYLPAEGKYDTFLEVRSTEASGQIERAWDPVCGWRWRAVRGERLAASLVPLPNSPPPSPFVAAAPPPVVVLPAPVPAPVPVVISAPPAPIVAPPPPQRTVAEILAGIPSKPEGLIHIFPLPVPAPGPQLQPLFGGLSLATPANHASGSLGLVLPGFTSSVSAPPPPPRHPSPPAEADHKPPANDNFGFVVPPPSLSLPAGADHKPQADDIPGPNAAPPLHSSSFAFGPGSGAAAPFFGADFGAGFAAPAPAPSFGGAFGAGLAFAPTPSFSSGPASRPSSRRRGGGRGGNVIYQLREVAAPGIKDDADDKASRRESPLDAGLDSIPLVMGADFGYVSSTGLDKIADYISGSSLASFETNLRRKENGLRSFANLLRWQCKSGQSLPPGGTVALGQLISVLARVDGLVTGFVADNGGQQQLFEGGNFYLWARAWRYLETVGWQENKVQLQRELDAAVFGQLEELVRKHQAHWVRFLKLAGAQN